jgi:hypothetical protein
MAKTLILSVSCRNIGSRQRFSTPHSPIVSTDLNSRVPGLIHSARCGVHQQPVDGVVRGRLPRPERCSTSVVKRVLVMWCPKCKTQEVTCLRLGLSSIEKI